MLNASVEKQIQKTLILAIFFDFLTFSFLYKIHSGTRYSTPVLRVCIYGVHRRESVCTRVNKRRTDDILLDPGSV